MFSSKGGPQETGTDSRVARQASTASLPNIAGVALRSASGHMITGHQRNSSEIQVTSTEEDTTPSHMPNFTMTPSSELASFEKQHHRRAVNRKLRISVANKIILENGRRRHSRRKRRPLPNRCRRRRDQGGLFQAERHHSEKKRSRPSSNEVCTEPREKIQPASNATSI